METPFNHPPLGRDAEEKFLVNLFGSITTRLKTQYKYSDAEFYRLWNTEEILIPATIFAGELSPAEAISKYLKENCSLSYKEIATKLGRDERSVWCNYQRAQKKMPWPFQVDMSFTLPLSSFSKEKSILECTISYLKDAKGLTLSKISQILKKNPSNVWTVYHRSKKKEGQHG